MTAIYLQLVGDELETRDASAWFSKDFPGLAYSHDLYFKPDELALNLPATQLIATRARLEGLENAAGLMRRAAAGEIDRRAPLDVRPYRDGLFLVLDGNSTFLTGLASGWPDFPCRLVEPEAGESPRP